MSQSQKSRTGRGGAGKEGRSRTTAVDGNRDSRGRVTAASPRRTQGRPTEASHAVGPEALIKAAMELLEQMPPAKVTRAAVARHARVDPSLIRYYFSDRDSLLVAVLHRIVGEARSQHVASQAGTAADRLRERVRGVFQFNATYPFVHRLVAEEIAPSASAEAREAFQRENLGSIAAFDELLKEGSKDGSLRKVDPVLLHIAVLGMCDFFVGSGSALQDAVGKSTSSAAAAKRYAEFISTLVVDGLKPR